MGTALVAHEQAKGPRGAVNDETAIINEPAASLEIWSHHWTKVFRHTDTVSELATTFLDAYGTKLAADTQCCQLRNLLRLARSDAR